jgi:UDP-N-acetylmuramoylalanine--D-glutamate ligase
MVTFSSTLRGKRVLLIGLGLHGGGVATARWLVTHGARLTVTDSKPADQLAPSLQKLRGLSIAYVLGRHRIADVRAADLIIQNPGVPNDSPLMREARRLHKPIHNEASLFFSVCPAPIIGVTGTRGKSTTADLIATLLRSNTSKKGKVWLGGNIRIPMLDFVDRIRPRDVVVLELSSWQLEGTAAYHQHPQIAVITNVYPDHLSRYSGMANYAKAKAGILRWQTADEYAVVNRENAYTAAIGKAAPGQVSWFGKKLSSTQDGAYIKNKSVMVRQANKEIVVASVGDMQLLGAHNLENVLAAVIVARLYGVTVSAIRKTLKAYRGLPDRLEIVGTYRGVTYINDTTASSPDGVVAALRAVGARWSGRRIVLIAGGADKGIPTAAYATLRQEIKRHCRGLVLFTGAGSKKIGRPAVPSIEGVGTMVEAVGLARTFARRGDVILLSPASASFGLFVHEFARGEEFRVAARTIV